MEALFSVLYQSHWPAALMGSAGFFDNEERINGEHAKSLAESLRNRIEMLAHIKDQNSANSHKQGYNERSKRLAWQVQRLKCLADILNALVTAWNRNAQGKLEKMIAAGQEYIFDDSDGEQVFALNGASPMQGGARDKPVPTGEITRVIRLPVKSGKQESGESEHPKSGTAHKLDG
jgi:hypothetical protein